MTMMARRRRRIEQRDDGAPAEIKKIAKCWGNRGARKKESYMGGFCSGWSHDLGQKALLSRVVASLGKKDPPFVPGEATTRDKRCF